MNTSQFQFTDKQIMDQSNSQSNNGIGTHDFLDLMNTREDHQDKKEEIVPNYDFQPIRPVGSSSAPSKLDSGNVVPIRAWNSADNNSNSPTTIRNYSSFDSYEPAKVVLEKDHNSVNPALLAEIDLTMKKYADDLLHALEGVSARLSQLESRTRRLENSMDDLKVSVGNSFGTSDGRIRQLENILREVQDGVHVVREKQEIMDARLQLAKLQVSKVEQHVDAPGTEHVDSSQSAAPTVQQPPQLSAPLAIMQQSPTLPSPNAPPPPPSQQILLPPPVQQPNQFPHTQIPSVSQREPYFPPPGQAPDNPGQLYQMHPPQQLQPSSQSLPQQQYQSLPPAQYSQLPAAPQQHASIPAVNPSMTQPPLGHPPEEPPYAQSQNYPLNIRQPPSHPASIAPPPQQFYGAPTSMYEPPASRPSPGFSGAYGPSSGSHEPYPYTSSPLQYSSGSPMKSQQHPPAMGHTGGSSYPQLPTARILPQALPTASPIGGGTGSTGSGNRVPIDDVIDKVTNMGFPRDQVRATVGKLTENGQSVDLNVVLDKLMNDVEGQPPRGWFGR